MTEAVPCLLRVGENVKKYRLFKLDKDQVTIGRSGEVTYAILSNMISRCHAVIDRREDGSWDLTDKKSLNGVYVNGRQLVPFQPYTMQDGDLIQLGVATSPNTPAEFIYKFYSSLKVRVEKKSNKRLKTELSSQKDTLSASEAMGSDSEQELKRKKPNEEGMNSPSKSLRQQMELSQKEQAVKEAEYQARLAEMERLLKEKEDKQLEVQQQLERERQERECQAKEVEELKQKEQAILLEMQNKQEQLEKEKELLKQKMQEELEANLRDREQALRAQLASQREALMNEKKQIEDNLQKEMEKALEEKNKELEKELQEQKQKLEKVIEKKELEQKVLESQLNETKEESATAKMQALKARDDVLSNFVDLMEMELQCTICNELFIKATSLNCAHVFCKLCISQWMKVKKECPNCRTAITSQVQALALDSYIDRMVEQLNDELKQRRTELLEIRKAEQEKFDVVAAGPSTTQPSIIIVGGGAAQGASSSSSTTSSTNTRRTSRRARPRRGGAVTTASRNTAGASVEAIIVSASSTARSTASNAAATSTAMNAVAATTAATTTVSSTATRSVVAAAASAVASASSAPVAASSGTDPTTAASGAIVPATTSNVIELSSDRDEGGTEDELTDSDESFGRYRRHYGRSYISTDDDDDEYDDNESVEGDPRAYYGGYGRCYNCGMRGHWANGCPN
ncbi:E3 ubiquitin-protein ligase rnf8 [Plakobranchus ocellatus]|uniref:E3 ubiquitin-protein ligase CHFR n=1 Tax=Plakobranchus ocellatus TaxID=259542 RepID=A0AAV4ASE6_9GAST|nr:E3 ubiquitin-protein ligase rnf8 [Plakobranchus ocellatus]